jgi:hypothetical protein
LSGRRSSALPPATVCSVVEQPGARSTGHTTRHFLIQSRTEAGTQKAREQGKKFGRPSALEAGQKRKIADRYAAGETMAELAREYEVGEATIFRALKVPA